MTNCKYDPRTDSLADLRAEKSLFNVWQGREHLGSGAHWLTDDFLDHAWRMYCWEGKRGEESYSDSPGIPKSPFNGGNGYNSVMPLEGNTAVRYARHIIKERLLEANLPDVEVLAELIPCPEGWEKEIREDVTVADFACKYDNWPSEGARGVILTAPDGIRIIFNLRPVIELNPWSSGGVLITVDVSGHTNFKATKEGEENWYTKSRRGHNDSFYAGDLTDFDALIEEQIREALESRARIEGMITVPGLEWSINPADKEKIADRIRSDHGYSFVPAAMGTGLRLFTKRERWGGRAPKATEDYFGISPIYTQSLDCD